MENNEINLNQLNKENEIQEAKFEFTGILKNDSEGGAYRELPKRATKNAAGYDFFNPVQITIPAHSMKLVTTGIKAKFPDYFCLKLYNRSSNPKKKGLVLINGVGVVDADYYENPDNDGDIGFMFYNIKDEDVTLEPGEKLGQGVFELYGTLTNETEVTDERTSGWGSTGK